ncbi:tetratricopeptide repeat protein [Shimazuella kribbensis]|uniref:tetratricopeptide repeat protein n=1 Tax=Shimazuella kribbensis TaxID=139808 RepID=UPI000400B238|nr:tetratricopeptide repeat protein [Shimazuella kribbensis]
MFHEVWLQDMEEQINELKENYPHSSTDEKFKWRKRFSELKQASHLLLEAWAKVEDKMASISADHPELSSEDEMEIEDEFWLHESVVRQFRQGQGYYGLTMFQEAESFFSDVVEEEPDFLLGRLYLGLSQFHSKDWDAAYQHFHLVSVTATQSPFLAFAHHMIGCIRVKQRNETAAIRSFQQAIGQDKENADTWFNLGAAYYRLKQYHEAIPVFYHALALNEHDWEAMYYLSSCYRQHGEWNSVTYWRLASLEKTNHPQVMLSLAHDYEEMEQPDQAIIWYRKLLSHPEHRKAAYHGLSWNHWTLKNKTEAELWVKKGLTIFPNDPDLLFTFMWIQLAEGDTKRAEKAYEMLSDEVKSEPIWQAMKMRISTRSGKFEEVDQLAQTLINQEKPMVQAMGYYHQGRTMLEIGRIPEAMNHFQLARKRATKWQEPLFYEGVCHLLEGRPEQTLECWGQLNLT